MNSIVGNYWEEFMHARVWVKKEREEKKNVFLLEHRLRANAERKRRCARVPAVCVSAAVRMYKIVRDLMALLPENALFETTEERVDFSEETLFSPQTSFHLFSEKDEKWRDERIFVELAKIKKTVLSRRRKRRERRTYYKTTQKKTRRREKEKRKEKLCVFNVGVGRAWRRWWTP